MGTSLKTGNKSIFISLAGIIQKFCMRIESIPGKLPEFIACIVYVVTHIFISSFHEPWYDEAVAWQIARCASIKDILFEIPHFEGHPPLWHIILLPFAKLGVPYELSLCLVSLIFAGAACCLIIWKSPFPRIIRLLLPFTYFFFYQYGVISRPYCVMMLAFVLLAMAHKKRDEKPGIYVALLMLLCLTSAYGILIAGGLSIAWILEMWNFQKVIDFIKKMLRDKRTIWLLVLLVFALLLIATIKPREATHAMHHMTYNIAEIIRCIIYLFFALPSELSVTTVYSEYVFLKNMEIPWISLIIVSILGILIWFFIFRLGKCKKTLLTLIIPYVMFATFSALVYICAHHTGIGILIFVFWFWITLEKEIAVNIDDIIKKGSEYTKNLVSALLVLFGSLAMIISLSWSIISCVQDIIYSYSIGRNEAEFIKENGLDNYNIMAGFDVTYEKGKAKNVDYNYCLCADNIVAYFDNNIFYNFNNGEDSLAYSTHKIATQEEEEEIISNWKTKQPDVLYLYPSIELVYEDIDPYKYKLVFYQKNYKIWKGFLNLEESKIFAHEDLVEELDLEVCSRETFERWMSYLNLNYE